MMYDRLWSSHRFFLIQTPTYSGDFVPETNHPKLDTTYSECAMNTIETILLGAFPVVAVLAIAGLAWYFRTHQSGVPEKKVKKKR